MSNEGLSNSEILQNLVIDKLSKIEESLHSIKERLHANEMQALQEITKFQDATSRMNELEKSFAIFRTKIYVTIAILAIVLEVTVAIVPSLL